MRGGVVDVLKAARMADFVGEDDGAHPCRHDYADTLFAWEPVEARDAVPIDAVDKVYFKTIGVLGNIAYL